MHLQVGVRVRVRTVEVTTLPLLLGLIDAGTMLIGYSPPAERVLWISSQGSIW